MTDPVKGISGAQGTSAGGSYSGGRSAGGHAKRGTPAPQDDVIEISQDARNCSEEKKKKGIIDYLKDLFG
ncbi:MAG: hypothetical protein PHI31_06200 [Desulfuromonadaceae bacterium]|nr:hypothetical protein [Desulfuromonadaceae bacterium]